MPRHQEEIMSQNKIACGKCCSCNERLEAFANIVINDPIEYAIPITKKVTLNILRAGHARLACEVNGAVKPSAAGTHRSDSRRKRVGTVGIPAL